MGTCWSAIDVISDKDLDNYPGLIGLATDISGGIAEFDPLTQMVPGRKPEGPFDTMSTMTRWSLIIKVPIVKRNPKTGVYEEKLCRIPVKVKSRWIADRTGKRWERYIWYR